MVPTARPVPGQTDEQFFEDVRAGRSMGGKYKPKEYAAWLESQKARAAARCLLTSRTT